MDRVLLLVGVFVFLFSGSRADVDLDGQCKVVTYCPGETVSFTCTSDSAGNTSVYIRNPDDTFEQVVQYSDSSETIGVVQMGTIGDDVIVKYNKTDDDSIWVWFKASEELDGYFLECRDIDDDGAENCTLQVNTASVPSAENFGIDNPRYCDSTNFTWTFTNGTGYSCLKEFVINVDRNVGEDIEYTVDPDSELSYTMTEAIASDTEACLSIASRSYEEDLFISDEQCVKFDVPKQPKLMESYNISNQNIEGEIDVTVNWTRPDRSRPNVMWYHIWTNITDNDNDNDNDNDEESSGSGQQPRAGDMMDMYRNIRIPGDRMMMRLPGAKEGDYYTVRLTAENCYGNSSTTISFKVEREVTPTPTTTPEPSSSPTLDDESEEGLATWAIAVIAIAASLLIVCLVISVLLIICCCCFGTMCATDKGQDIEMEKRGTHL